MSTVFPPVNIRAGIQNLVVPSSGGVAAPGTVAIVVYNLTGDILTIVSGDGSGILQPNQANAFSSTNATPAPQVLPTGLAPAGTYVGVVQSVSYDINDVALSGFPLPLIPFAGGSTLLIAGMFTMQPGQTIIIEPPPGTGVLQFQNLTYNATLFEIVGTLSNTVYYTGSGSLNPVGPLFTFDVDLSFDVDQFYTILFNGNPGATATWSNLYAAPPAYTEVNVVESIPTVLGIASGEQLQHTAFTAIEGGASVLAAPGASLAWRVWFATLMGPAATATDTAFFLDSVTAMGFCSVLGPGIAAVDFKPLGFLLGQNAAVTLDANSSTPYSGDLVVSYDIII